MEQSAKTHAEIEQKTSWVTKKELTTCKEMVLRSAKKGSFETEI